MDIYIIGNATLVLSLSTVVRYQVSLCAAVVSLTGDEGLAGLVLRKALQKLAHLLSECGETAAEEIDVLVKETCSVVEVCDHHCVE